MRHNTHKAIGMATYSIVINILYCSKTFSQYIILLLIMPIALISSKCPDKLENKFKLPHREISHSLTIWLFLSIVVSFFLYSLLYKYIEQINFLVLPITIAFSLSYFMHIFADSFTDNGVQLLWPYKRNKARKPIYRLWYYSEGEKYERYITMTANVITLSIWISIFYHMVK